MSAATSEGTANPPASFGRSRSALVIAFGVALPIFVLWLFNESNPFAKPYPVPHLLPHNHLVEMFCLVAGALDAVGILICWLCLLGVLHSKVHGLIGQVIAGGAALSFFILVEQFVPEVALHQSSLAPLHIKMPTGMSVAFVNPLGGTTQVVCVGIDGVCQPESAAFPAPRELNGGLRMLPGETVLVMFGEVGDYPITCQKSPTMNMLIQTVTPEPDSGDAD